MKLSHLPIALCHANCPRCGLPTDFKIFEPAGAGGDFATYVGAQTGSIYRVDLGKIHHSRVPLSDVLLPAEKVEGRLYRMPKEIRCKICGTVFSAASIMADSEEIVDAYEL